mmetsp:Transcript_8211/g.22278  ORF Transcript_8211/g.22278 Transcript_8211/m.22278 type:complete len:215 (-) Transcript_8211:1509-2153(-)
MVQPKERHSHIRIRHGLERALGHEANVRSRRFRRHAGRARTAVPHHRDFFPSFAMGRDLKGRSTAAGGVRVCRRRGRQPGGGPPSAPHQGRVVHVGTPSAVAFISAPHPVLRYVWHTPVIQRVRHSRRTLAGRGDAGRNGGGGLLRGTGGLSPGGEGCFCPSRSVISHDVGPDNGLLEDDGARQFLQEREGPGYALPLCRLWRGRKVSLQPLGA